MCKSVLSICVPRGTLYVYYGCRANTRLITMAVASVYIVADQLCCTWPICMHNSDQTTPATCVTRSHSGCTLLQPDASIASGKSPKSMLFNYTSWRRPGLDPPPPFIKKTFFDLFL